MTNLLKRRITVSLIFVILIGLFVVTINLEYNRVIETEKEELGVYLESLEAEVDKLFNQRIINLKGLIPYIQLNPDITQEEFGAFGSRLLSKDDVVIKDITFATDTTITHFYPVEGNEAIAGVDVATLEGQTEKVLIAKEKGVTVIDGPFPIVEGGLGIICRIPVFLNTETEYPSYFGQLNYVVNFNTLLNETGLQEALDNYNFRITQIADVDNVEKVIVSSFDDFSADAVEGTLQLPNVQWKFTIEYEDGYNGRGIVFYCLCILGIITISLAMYSTNTILKSKYALERSLDELQITQDKLVLSEKLAALGSLTAGVAHEINTPLGNCISIVSYINKKAEDIQAQLIANKLTQQELESFLESNLESDVLIVRNLRKIVTLVEKFKRLTSESQILEVRYIELKPFILDMMNELQMDESKEISINYHVEDIKIYSDPIALSNIITNLFSNSVAHGFESIDSKEVNINVYKNELGNEIIIEYWDNGVGISEDIRDNIFTPFYSTKKNLGHVGLGLHVVYNAVVNSLNGSIELSRNKDGYDVFLISFSGSMKENSDEYG